MYGYKHTIHVRTSQFINRESHNKKHNTDSFVSYTILSETNKKKYIYTFQK